MRRSSSTPGWRVLAITMMSAAILTSVGCGDDEEAESCAGRNLVPHLAPVSFNELYPPAEDVPDELGSSIRTPYEWVLRLQARGIVDGKPSCEAVAIDEVCLVGPSGAAAQFITYPDAPLSAVPGDSNDAAIQVTYQRDSPSSEVDNVALVVQSNATNFPSLVIPICARVIPDGEPKNLLRFEEDLENFPSALVVCNSPVQAPPAGQRDDTLCP